MHFDFIDLRLLAAVLETGSITAGAERVGLSLAAASARMRGLEQQAGVALLTRNPRGVQATPPVSACCITRECYCSSATGCAVIWPSSRRASAASCASSPIPSPPTPFCRSCWRIF
ncbi:LysR family transcriptional regulator [Serratia marcescens]